MARKNKDKKEREGKTIKGCKMILCEDPITGNIKLFPVACPKGYIDKMKKKMRDTGVKFSEEPLPEGVTLNIPEE